MKKMWVRAEARGCVYGNGLTSWRSFSFSDYLNPCRQGFGALRAVNEEILAPGMRVPLHAHENMEIISIPLTGTLHYHDSRGHDHIITSGDIHVLSAGLGITHWEANYSAHEPAHYLQVWIAPAAAGRTPDYRCGRLLQAGVASDFVLVAGPACAGGIVEINQSAWVSWACFDAGEELHYAKCQPANALYVFVVEGRITLVGDELAKGDSLGITLDAPAIMKAQQVSKVLCIEVPLDAREALSDLIVMPAQQPG